jgi:hypothetical protein
MLTRPGGGNLSAGFQQVERAAFMLSEWIHVQPNEWYAEGPAILGAYGWGLQGWDVSYWFQMGSSRGRWSETIGRNAWDATNPVGLATMAAVSRMVRRLDVAESPVTHALHAHLPSLHAGKESFVGTTVQDHDEKAFATDRVPPEALAAVRVAVDFGPAERATERFDLARFLGEDGRTIVSSTGQLRWTPGEPGDSTSGHFTIATPGTKGFVGFAPGDRAYDLGDGWSITPRRGFAVILFSAREPGETLARARDIVVVAMARGRNTGMRFSDGGRRVEERGVAPLLLEPVGAEVVIPFSGELAPLDHDGNAPLSTRRADRALTLDGAADRTPFYRLRR